MTAAEIDIQAACYVLGLISGLPPRAELAPGMRPIERWLRRRAVGGDKILLRQLERETGRQLKPPKKAAKAIEALARKVVDRTARNEKTAGPTGVEPTARGFAQSGRSAGPRQCIRIAARTPPAGVDAFGAAKRRPWDLHRAAMRRAATSGCADRLDSAPSRSHSMRPARVSQSPLRSSSRFRSSTLNNTGGADGDANGGGGAASAAEI